MRAHEFKTTFTAEEYLAMEAVSPTRNEFLDGHIFAMAGGTIAHAVTCGRVRDLLGRAFPDCVVVQSELRLRIPGTDGYVYPDVQVICGRPGAHDIETDAPCALVDVLSPSTAAHDRDEKLPRYLQIGTVHDVLLIDPQHRRVSHFRRTGEGTFVPSEHVIESTIRLSNEAEITLADIFEPADRLRAAP